MADDGTKEFKSPDEETDEEALLTRPFSKDERRDLRKMLERYRHRIWLRTVIGVYAKWLGAIGTAAVAIKLFANELKEFLR